MFTGIVERVGDVAAVRPHDRGARLEIDLGDLAADARLGDSICVSGACLTIAALSASLAVFDVSAETLRKTTIGSWSAGTPVNLERALTLGQRLGGHLVSGHVDGVGRLLERRREGASEHFVFLLPDDGSVRAVEKGSIAIDGTSLTSWDCRGVRLSIAVIPHTLERTTLGTLRPGTPVNMEMDVIGRWVETLLTERGLGAGG